MCSGLLECLCTRSCSRCQICSKLGCSSQAVSSRHHLDLRLQVLYPHRLPEWTVSVRRFYCMTTSGQLSLVFHLHHKLLEQLFAALHQVQNLQNPARLSFSNFASHCKSQRSLKI